MLAEKPSDKVNLAMSCASEGDTQGSCGSSLDITKQLTALPLNEWHSMSIDMACYANTGVSMGDLVVPFELSSKGTLKMNIAEIKFEPKTATEATISCQ
jgi:beta-glucosidase